MNTQVSKKWKQVKEIMSEGLSPSVARTMDVCLDNVLRATTAMSRKRSAFLMENASAGATASANIAALNQATLPLMRRVLPGVICNELVGVQPLTGPYGLIGTMRWLYGQSVGGVSAGMEAMAPRHVNAFASAFSGNESTVAPGTSPTSSMEGVPGNSLYLDLVKEQVTVGSRRLSGRWTIEATQDAQAQWGVDLESEYLSVLAQNMTVEIDQEILFRLRQLPPTAVAANTFDQAALSGNAITVVDEHAVLAVLIQKEANDIATRTRMEPGNWIVISPTVLTVLQSAKASAFSRTTEGEFEGPTNVKLVGTLNGAQKVFVDVFAADSTPVLIGYKGNDVQAGLYYCPYIPLMQTDIVTDPHTLEMQVGFMTRYSIVTLTNRNNSLGNASDFYGLVGINNTNLSFR